MHNNKKDMKMSSGIVFFPRHASQKSESVGRGFCAFLKLIRILVFSFAFVVLFFYVFILVNRNTSVFFLVP